MPENLKNAVNKRVAQLRHKAGMVVDIISPSLGFHHQCAVGRARNDSAALMDPSTPFHIASVGKTMTAALVLILCEEQRLGPAGVDTRLGSFSGLTNLLNCLDKEGQECSLRDVTVRQLLNHSSGLKDAFSDDAKSSAVGDNGPAPGSFSVFLRGLVRDYFASPQVVHPALQHWKVWDHDHPADPVAGVLNWFIASGTAHSRLGVPGQLFHYSDSGYMVLALLCEVLTGKSYAELLHEHIFRPLSMNDTFLAYSAFAPDRWERTVSDFLYQNRPFFSSGLNASWDWGGGGQVSTAHDLNQFLFGLLGGKLFRHATTLGKMLDLVSLEGLPDTVVGWGLGIRKHVVPGPLTLWGHSGAWSVQMFYCPEVDTYISGTANVHSALYPELRMWAANLARVIKKRFDVL